MSAVESIFNSSSPRENQIDSVAAAAANTGTSCCCCLNSLSWAEINRAKMSLLLLLLPTN
jgi:hypothetical protein